MLVSFLVSLQDSESNYFPSTVMLLNLLLAVFYNLKELIVDFYKTLILLVLSLGTQRDNKSVRQAKD
jgi:hypothetical protein